MRFAFHRYLLTVDFPGCVKMANLLYGQIVKPLIIKALTIYQSGHLTIFTQSVASWATNMPCLWHWDDNDKLALKKN